MINPAVSHADGSVPSLWQAIRLTLVRSTTALAEESPRHPAVDINIIAAVASVLKRTSFSKFFGMILICGKQLFSSY